MQSTCVLSFGIKLWYLGKKVHREDGPAKEWPNGCLEYWQNDEMHRTDGPAGIYPDQNILYWRLHGEAYSFNEWARVVGISGAEKTKLILQYNITEFESAYG